MPLVLQMLSTGASCQDHFFFQAEDGIRDYKVTGVQTCALPISGLSASVVQFFSSSALQFSSAIALSAITLRHIWPSAARKSSSWAWVWGFLAARVWLPRALANSGLSMTLLTAACRVLRASAGVPAGTAMPNQVEALKPGTPDSAMVGVCGRNCERSGPVVAMATSLPALMWGREVPATSTMSWVSLAMRAVRAGALPLKGMWVAATSRRDLISSVVSCSGLPRPTEL